MSEAGGSATIVAFSGPEHLGRVRLIAACFAENVGMDRGETEDVALAVTEACVNAIRHGSNGHPTNVVVSFQALDRALTAEVTDFGGASAIPGAPEGPRPGYGLKLMRELCDCVEYALGTKGLTLRLTKHAKAVAASAAV